MRYAVFAVMALLVPSPLGRLPWIDITVPVSEPYASRIQADMQEIVDRGWGIVAPGEFYHGHILLGPQAAEYPYFSSMDEVLLLSVGALYHTDEQIVLWEAQAHLEPAARTPRSIVSIWGGGMFPAYVLVPEPQERASDYVGFGTIHAHDLYRARPDIFYNYWNYEIRTKRARCLTGLQFTIPFTDSPREDIEIDSRRYGLDFWCHPGSEYQ